MHIRELQLDDIPHVYRLGKIAFIEEKGERSFVYSYWSLQQLAQVFEDYPQYSLVMEQEGEEGVQIVGFVIGHPTYEGIVDVSYLEWLAVHPEFRKQGIGSRLVERLLNVFKENGSTEVVTDVKGVNKESIGLFRDKMGFTEEETVTFLMKSLD